MSYYDKLQSLFLIDCGGGEQVKKQNYFDENHYLSKLNNLIKNRRFYDDKILINGIIYTPHETETVTQVPGLFQKMSLLILTLFVASVVADFDFLDVSLKNTT